MGPNVVAFAQQYFNCSSLQGVRLEVAGGDGSAGSHWEMMTIMNEYMVAELGV